MILAIQGPNLGREVDLGSVMVMVSIARINTKIKKNCLSTLLKRVRARTLGEC